MKLRSTTYACKSKKLTIVLQSGRRLENCEVCRVISMNPTTNSPSSGINKEKAKWDDPNTKAYLTICAKLVDAGYRPHTYLTAAGWSVLCDRFRETQNRTHSKKQMRNKWDALKKEYTTWCRCLQLVGLGWDPITKTISASEEWWQERGKIQPEILKWKKGPPKYLDLMEKVYGFVNAASEFVRVPQQMPHHPPSTSKPEQTNPLLPSSAHLKAVNGHSSGPVLTYNFAADVLHEPTSTIRSGSRRVSSEGRKRKRSLDEDSVIASNEQPRDTIYKLTLGLRERSEATSNKNETMGYEACMSLLEEVPGLVKTDPIYLDCYIMFNDPENRRSFLRMMQTDRDLAYPLLCLMDEVFVRAKKLNR